VPLATSPFPELPLREKEAGSHAAFLSKEQCQICTSALKFEFPRKVMPCECPVRKWVHCDPSQLIARLWQLLLRLVPAWFNGSHKQQKNLFQVAKWVFQVAAPALTRWCGPSAFWDVSALLCLGASGSRGWAPAGCKEPPGSDFYPAG